MVISVWAETFKTDEFLMIYLTFHVSDVLYLIPQLLDYFLTIISLERSMWEGPKRII